jgi:hypothetical protein
MPSRKKITISNVGTSWTEVSEVGFPDKFVITRVRAEIRSGTGTQVALSIRQKTNPVNQEDIILEYDLVTTLDYLEDALAIMSKRRDRDLGTLYIAAMCDVGTTNEVVITLEYVE